jgi:hypothetical protein
MSRFHHKSLFIVVLFLTFFNFSLSENQNALYTKKREQEIETISHLDTVKSLYHLPHQKKANFLLPEAITGTIILGLSLNRGRYLRTIINPIKKKIEEKARILVYARAGRLPHEGEESMVSKTKKYFFTTLNRHFNKIEKSITFGLPLAGWASYRLISAPSFREQIFKKEEELAEENILKKTRQLYKVKKIKHIFSTIFANLGISKIDTDNTKEVIQFIQKILSNTKFESKEKEKNIFDNLTLKEKEKAKKILNSLSKEEIYNLLITFPYANNDDSNLIRERYPYLNTSQQRKRKNIDSQEERKEIKNILKPTRTSYTNQEKKQFEKLDEEDPNYIAQKIFIHQSIKEKRKQNGTDLWKQYYLQHSPKITVSRYNREHEKLKNERFDLFL